MAGVMTVIVFDLDDTPAQYGRRKIAVPKQTWHALALLSRTAMTRHFVVSYNPLAAALAGQLGLLKHVEGVVSGHLPRDALLRVLFERYSISSGGDDRSMQFVYFDDREDNIEEVLASYPRAQCKHLIGPIACKDFCDVHPFSTSRS